MVRARLVLVGLIALLALGLWESRPTAPRRNSPPGGDIVLFRAVVERMRAGEPYYAAMRTELRNRAYPTASIFNWRPPATFMLLARAPHVTHAGLLALAILALALTVLIFRNASPMTLMSAILLQIGASALPIVPTDGLYLPETWVGIFLLLSILGYTLGAVRFAVVCAIAAACVRELAIPYVLTALALAVQARRADEVRWYVIGLVVFTAYYGAHVVAARSHIFPGDMFHTNSWIAFGGWHFVIRTVAKGGWYLLLPLWIAAVGAVVVLASLWGPADRHLKILVLIYLAGFTIVGQSFNSYWGLMTGPSWGLAVLYGAMGLGRLVRAALATSDSDGATLTAASRQAQRL